MPILAEDISKISVPCRKDRCWNYREYVITGSLIAQRIKPRVTELQDVLFICQNCVFFERFNLFVEIAHDQKNRGPE